MVACVKVQHYSGGGVVGTGTFNFNGTPDRSFFRPMGTDTVPAMLSDGEFVVNARSAQRHLPMLQHINEGKPLDSYQPVYKRKGGTIGHFQHGGFATSDTSIMDWSTSLDKMNTVFDRALGGFDAFGHRFATVAGELTGALNNLAHLRIPDTIAMEARHDVNVNINGAAVMQNLIPQIQSMITDSVSKQLEQHQGINKNSGYANPSFA